MGGAVIGMWIIVATKSRTGYVFIVPNSFVHSVMYFYYALSVWKIKVPFKYMLTRLQMVQFCIGALLGAVELYYWECGTFGDHLSLCWNTAYVPSLLLLFALFYRKTYAKERSQRHNKVDTGI